jgi:Mg2+ and Co2+ transporter CorA
LPGCWKNALIRFMEKAVYIPKTWELPEAIRKRLGASVGKQRLMDEDGHLLLLLHRVPRAEDDEIREAMVVWRNPAGEWKSAPAAGGLTGLEAHIASYRTAIHQLDEDVEAAKSARQYFEIMRRTHPLQRATRSLLEVVQATRQALPDESRIINLRDQAADLERGIELVAADAKAGMEFTVAESATQQAHAAELANREARRLNRLAAFFLPLATLVAVFGMNPPETMYTQKGFWVVLGAGILLGFMVRAVVALGERKKD